MKSTWDFSEIKEFAENLSQFSKLDEQMEKASKRLAKALLRWMKEFTPVDEYELINGWNGNKFAVTKTEDGFEVLIVNKTPYAQDVNDGHKAYNQYGGPYKIKHRIQVRSPHKWQRGASTWYVYGHFFVERGILRLTDTVEIEEIVFNELQKWWEKC